METPKTVGEAARLGNLEGMVTLIKSGHPVDSMDNRGWRPIHEAANDNHISCVKHLLENEKTDVNWRAFDQSTALLLASQNGHIDVVHLLIGAGADPNLPDCFQLTPLLAAVRSTKFNCVKQLLDAGARVDDQLYCGTTSLHQSAAEGFLDVVNCLLEYGASVDILEDYNITPVFTAAQYGHAECLKALLEASVKQGKKHVVDMAAEDGGTPLYLSAQEGHSKCIKLLMEYGANPNLTTQNPVSMPLHAAVQFERIRCVKQLLEVTDMNRMWDCEPYIFDLAMQSSSGDCLRTLLKSNISPDRCHLDEEQYYIATLSGIEHHLTFNQSSPALVWCAWHRYKKDHAKILIDHGACPNALSQDHLPPLLAAICKSQLETMKILIRSGASVEIEYPSIQGNIGIIACLHNWKCLSLLLLCNTRPNSLFSRTNSGCHSYQEGATCSQPLDLFSILTSARLVMSRRQITVGHVLYLLLNFTNSVLLDSRLKCFVEDNEQWNHIVNMAGNPSSLSHQSRLVIRAAIGSQRLCHLNSIDELPLPSVIKDYVMFKNLDKVINISHLLK